MKMTTAKVWLVTGASSGFGKEIALAALKRGDKVVAAGRSLVRLRSLEAEGAVTRELDVTWDETRMSQEVRGILDTVGHIDVVVNSAGYILQGAIEECSASEIQAQFATNVFGPANVLRAMLPHMRARRTGVVANLGSIGSWKGTPVAGFYCATKAAVSTFTEALRAEVAHLGIEVVTIEPGYFRTHFLSTEHKLLADRRITELDEAIGPIRDRLGQIDRNQPGDPEKGAQILVEALTKTGRCEGRSLPPRLALGKDAVPYIKGICDSECAVLDDWKDIVTQTDCEDVRA